MEPTGTAKPAVVHKSLIRPPKKMRQNGQVSSAVNIKRDAALRPGNLAKAT